MTAAEILLDCVGGRRAARYQLALLCLILAACGERDAAIATASGSEASGCPMLCVCKWRRGKETVSCDNAGYADIPRMRDGGTQVLNLVNFIVVGG